MLNEYRTVHVEEITSVKKKIHKIKFELGILQYVEVRVPHLWRLKNESWNDKNGTRLRVMELTFHFLNTPSRRQKAFSEGETQKRK